MLRVTRILAVLVVSTLMTGDGVASAGTQSEQKTRLIRSSFVVMPAYPGCYPVEATGIYLAGLPLNVILAQALIENRSPSSITTVKFGWTVYPSANALVKDFQCGVPSNVRVLLTGNSPLILLGEVGSNETCVIGPNPLIGKPKATKTVFVDFPIISTSDVESLPVNETTKLKQYAVALYLWEVHYLDGTIWSFEK